MLGFFLKKAFFDGWDNLFGIVFLNLGFLLLLTAGFFILTLGLPLPLIVFLALLLWFGGSVWYALVSLVTNRYADYRGFAFRDLAEALREALIPGLQAGALNLVAILVLAFGLPFWFARGMGGALAAGVLIWSGLAWFLGLQYFLSLRFRLGGSWRKNLRKCFILLFDNPWFSLFLQAWSLGTMAISLFLALLAPGFAGLALAQNDALKLRLVKYDWLEAQASPEAVGEAAKPGRGLFRMGKAVPWKALLAEESELVGKRTIRGMIFPWKD